MNLFSAVNFYIATESLLVLEKWVDTITVLKDEMIVIRNCYNNGHRIKLNHK
jgi:hypothetical protein